MRTRGWLVVLLAVGLLGGFLAWEWFLSPRARVERVLSQAAEAAEAADVETFLSLLAADYRDYLNPSREALAERLREAFERVDRTNVTVSAVDVEADGDAATARFDLVVVAIRGDERYVVLGTPFEPEKVTARFVREAGGWKIQSVDRRPPS
jgi:hypothetical protein